MRNLAYLVKLRVFSIEIRGTHMVSFVPLLIDKTAVVSEVFHDKIFCNFNTRGVNETLIRNFEHFLGSFTTKWASSALFDANRRSKILEDNVITAWHINLIKF